MFTANLPPFSIYHSIVISVSILIVAYVISTALYNLFLSPLSAIPGPWYAAISDFWLTTHVLRLQQCRTIHELFERYGPIVRVGPSKIVFNDLSTSRSVYTVHKFDKSTYYKSLLTNENDHSMTTLDHSSHSIRRRGWAPHYMPSNIVKFQPEIREHTLELVKILSDLDGVSPMECLTLFRQLMLDISVSTSYGYRLGAMSKFAMNAEDPLSTAISDFPKRGVLRSAVPAWVWDLICKIPNARWRLLCDSDKIMAEFVSERVYKARAQKIEGKLDDDEKIPMLHRLLKYRYSSTEKLMPDVDIISEHMGHMVAACDTTSTTFSYMFWELSRRSDIASKLREELTAVMHDPKDIPDVAILQSLPYLNAFIKEGLRLYGAAPSVLERVVPSSSCKIGPADDSFDLMGFALPPGTIVGTQAWSMHRNTSIFPSPDTFLPERWLITDEGKLAQMSANMMPFGTGTRVCGGQNMAQLALKIVIAALVRNFCIETPPETTEKSMEMKDSFVIFPAAMASYLTFKTLN